MNVSGNRHDCFRAKPEESLQCRSGDRKGRHLGAREGRRRQMTDWRKMGPLY